MFAERDGIGGWWAVRALVGVVIGVGLGTILAGDPVSIPLLGTVSGLAVGGVVAAFGGVLYTQLPDCGCGRGEAECDCGECGG
ncbi:hypothetical protein CHINAEXTREME_04110 [Halobiforma lacisalsi AJ5]|uniref:Uncharacterized protein n=1 Tax=Natronobacterium lacisalsi AJ5 TaxID=358396 RepID=M0LQJ6_NATLA|nr:hypothetical protein [Halobiforma lacisalsi]APW97003.1 hypothetical protein CHINAEXTREME_04110 [Halobiforma lacisalsi AJ5]EMA34719.1 hypothetical protein C445_07355 [Halobiforma lacisalsi AJ5]